MASCRVFSLLILCGLAAAQAAFATSVPCEARVPAEPGQAQREYLLLATTRTSTMQEEMTESANAGYRLEAVMGGGTAVGSETVVVMSKDRGAEEEGRYEYLLLATSKTSTMQRELQEAASEGFEYVGQTVFDTTFSGHEVVVILERDRNEAPPAREYKLLATKRTSTMQQELREAAAEGFELLGLTVATTAFGGEEVVCVLSRETALPARGG